MFVIVNDLLPPSCKASTSHYEHPSVKLCRIKDNRLYLGVSGGDCWRRGDIDRIIRSVDAQPSAPIGVVDAVATRLKTIGRRTGTGLIIR
jgi:hypothetical protein